MFLVQLHPQSAQLRWPGLGAARLAGPGGTDRRTDGLMAASLNAFPIYGEQHNSANVCCCTAVLPSSSVSVISADILCRQ